MIFLFPSTVLNTAPKTIVIAIIPNVFEPDLSNQEFIINPHQ